MLSGVKRLDGSRTRRRSSQEVSLREVRLLPNVDLKPNAAGRLRREGRSYRVRAIEGTYAFLEPVSTD